MSLTKSVQYVRELEDNNLMSFARALQEIREDWGLQIDRGEVAIEITIRVVEVEGDQG